MNTQFSIGALFLGLVCSVALQPVLAEEQEAPLAPATPFDVCTPCHNQDGNSTNPLWPHIAGQHENYLLKQLHAFREGAPGPRYNPVMYGIVAEMDDATLAMYARHYSKEVMADGATPQQHEVLGGRIYRGGNVTTGVTACSGCHGPAGEGNLAAGFPRVGGQMAEYLLAQLKLFQEGKRTTSINGMMHDITLRMSDEEMEAVSHYMAGLPGV